MPKTINLSYATLNNAGDIFNKPVVEKYSGAQVVRCKTYETDMLALGGGLANIQFCPQLSKKVAQKILGMTKGKKTLYVWGSGFLYGSSNEPFYRKDMSFHALRGELSRQKVSSLLKKEINVPLCDPGLLIDDVYPVSCGKEYRLGIISHYSEMDHDCFKQLLNSNSDSIFIDIRDNPDVVFEKICKCEYIISSSLHGLVFADAVGIPNLHIKVTDRLGGDGFKFNDYYSSFGIDHTCWDYQDRKEIPTIQNVIDLYAVPFDKVKKMKADMISAFPEKMKNK